MQNKNKQGQLRDVRDVLDVIGGRWKGAILASLCDGEKRFTELKNDLVEITPRTLTKELRYLEQNHLVRRLKSEGNAVAVIYQLTEHGHSLEPVIGTLVQWGKKHRKQVLNIDLSRGIAISPQKNKLALANIVINTIDDDNAQK
jgi:DNA-binding HxlR family transcriptional regulator